MKQEIKERVERIRRGEVPEGYKETKNWIIPSNWDETIFSSMMDGFSSGSTPPRNTKSFFKGDNLWITSGELNYNIIENSNEKITDEAIKKANLKVLNPGTFVIAITGLEAAGTRGSCGIVGKKLTTSQSCMALIPKSNLYLNFLFQFYCAFGEKIALKYTQGTKQQSYNGNLVRKLPIIKVPLNEQQKIAEILSTWDKAIELKEKQILHSNKSKKGFMQKLLFKGVTSNILWSETQLRKCLVPTSYPVNKPSEPYYALGIRSHCKGTFVRHVEDPKKIAMNTLYEIKENELIVNITFAWEGAITLLNKKDEGKLVSHRFPTYKFNEEYTIPDYFKHLVKTKWFVFQLGSLSPGGAGRNRVFNKTDFLKLKVLLPSVEEQRKIADFLNSIDNEIDLLNKELNQLKEQKRGLMQLLLTGIVRVEVD